MRFTIKMKMVVMGLFISAAILLLAGILKYADSTIGNSLTNLGKHGN